MKEMLFLFITTVSYYCHLEWFVLSTQFDTHKLRAEAWLLDHLMMRLRGSREEIIGQLSEEIAMGNGKGVCLDESG